MKKIHWILLITLVALVCSCEKETRYHLTAVDKQMCPYKMGDTVRYTNAYGEVIILTTKGISTDWERWDRNVWFQYQKTSALSNSGDFGLTITIFGIGYGSELNRSLMVLNRAPGSLDYISYNSAGNFNVDTGNRTHNYYVYDSLLIGNHFYYEVAGSVNMDFHSGQITSELYYNKTHGVLQMKKDGKAVFTLQEYIPAR